MAGLQYAGEYQIKELLIHTSSGSVLNLTKATQSIDIYEDMFKTALSGSITILDVDNIAENGPIIGQEYMTIRLTTPSLDEEELDEITTTCDVDGYSTPNWGRGRDKKKNKRCS